MGHKVFFIAPTERQKLYLRRYRASGDTSCAGSYCNAMTYIGDAPIVRTPDGSVEVCDDLKPLPSDSRWPTKCESCGAPFAPTDPYQLFTQPIYCSIDGSQEMTLRDAPAGAVWNAWWIADRRRQEQRGCGWMVGPDGRSLVVRMPDGSDWMIDSRARNCTLRDDDIHFCWVRHGKPEDGTLHVDKSGHTCAAGAGSIDTGKWHGFLHGGELRSC